MDLMKIKFLNLHLLFCLTLFASCGGISVISQNSTEGLYTKGFLAKISLVKALYKKGNTKLAMNKLKAVGDDKLLPAEEAMRRNLFGVFYFSKKNYEQAILNFELALPKSRLDQSLTAQIYLNLASSYYKLGHIEKALATTNLCEKLSLGSDEERKKYHRLRATLASELGQSELEVEELIQYLTDKESIASLKSEPLFEKLLSKFFSETPRNRLRVFEKFEDSKIFNISYLAYLNIEKLYYRGNKDEAGHLIDWLLARESQFVEVTSLVENLQFRISNYSKMTANSIGIILPLSGKKSRFGKRALLGVDSGVRILSGEKKEGSPKFNLHIGDSKGSGVVGALKVKELIEKHYVSTIIGGLFSAEATKEYLEARKHGVFFISLSEIYLPKEQKDHLLLEIPGSVESQVARLFSDDMLKHFGKKGAIIFPKTNRGDAFVNEFWRKANQSKVSVVGVHSFEKNATDHRGTVKNLLGIKYPRERQEELELLSEIHSLEKNSTIRRIQTLKPKIDFDWVFLPIYPKEAIQLIPAFTYYDAFKLNLIGGPSWRSRALVKDSYKLGKLHFIGDGIKDTQVSFKQKFEALYKKRPKLIEMRSYDAYQIIMSLLKESEFSTRDEFDQSIRTKEELEGITGNWKLNDGIWIKEMSPLKIHRSKITSLYEELKPKEEVLK